MKHFEADHIHSNSKTKTNQQKQHKQKKLYRFGNETIPVLRNRIVCFGHDHGFVRSSSLANLRELSIRVRRQICFASIWLQMLPCLIKSMYSFVEIVLPQFGQHMLGLDMDDDSQLSFSELKLLIVYITLAQTQHKCNQCCPNYAPTLSKRVQRLGIPKSTEMVSEPKLNPIRTQTWTQYEPKLNQTTTQTEPNQNPTKDQPNPATLPKHSKHEQH